MSGLLTGPAHVLQGIFDLFAGAVNAVFFAIQSAFRLTIDLLSNIVDLFGGIVGFLLGNLFTILILGGIFFAYVRYQNKQGKTVGFKKA